MTKARPDKKDSETYQSMLGELDDIVRQVSQGHMDLDAIVSRVEYGYKLIATMRQRLDATKLRVEKLRVDFETSESKHSRTSVQDPSSTTEKSTLRRTKQREEDDRDDVSDDTQDDDDTPF
jgi:exodeoxyribonuclease VII small subunit